MDNAEWEMTLHYKAKNLAYSLNFHSISNHISANYYEEMDKDVTYLETVSTSLSSACAGSLMTSFVENSKNTRMKMFASALTLTSATTAAFIANLNNTEHSPAKKQHRHNKGAYRMKELCKKVDAWSDAALDRHVPDGDLQQLEKFNEFIEEQHKIEEECLRSEDWTFTQVHDQLSPQWKALGRKLGKFFPDQAIGNRWSFLTMKWAILFGTLATLVALWKVVDHCIDEN